MSGWFHEAWCGPIGLWQLGEWVDRDWRNVPGPIACTVPAGI